MSTLRKCNSNRGQTHHKFTKNMQDLKNHLHIKYGNGKETIESVKDLLDFRCTAVI